MPGKSKNFRVLLVYVNSMLDNAVPVTISLIASCLKQKGFVVDLFDTTCYRTAEVSGDQKRVENLQVRPFNFEQYGVKIKKSDILDDFFQKVLQFKPNLIGLSVVETTFELAVKLLKRIRKLKIPNIVGGIHAILDAHGVINNENVDMVCTGEGEELICELCARLANRASLQGIAGLWFKRDGKIIKNPARKHLADLDKIPYLDFSLFEKERFYKPMAGKIYKMVPVEMSRGCYYNCSFCCDQALNQKFSDAGRWYRTKGIDRIFDEIRFYKHTYHAQYLYFVSETFLTPEINYLREFAARYKEIGLPFWFNTRPETVGEEKVKLLEEMGCDRISIGIEHGNENFRKKILNRKYSNQLLLKVVNILTSSKIPISLNNIIGFPGENRELVFDTINLIRKFKLRKRDSISCFFLSPFKGTKLRQLCVEKGYIDKNENVPDNNIGYILRNPGFKQDEIFGLLRTFTAYCRLPEKYFPLIRRAEKFTEEGNRSFARIREIYSQTYFS